MTKSFKFLNFDCKVQIFTYNQGGIAIQLVAADFDCDKQVSSGEPIATATVNIEGLEQNEVAIKNYSENEGMLELFRSLNFVDSPHRWVESGFINLPICKFNEKVIREYLYE